MSERTQQTGIDPLLDDLEKRGWQVELTRSNGTVIELRREGVTIVANGSTWFASVKMVADGVEVVIEPGRAGLSPEQVRSFVKGVMTLYAQLNGGQSGQARAKQGHEQEPKGRQDESE